MRWLLSKCYKYIPKTPQKIRELCEFFYCLHLSATWKSNQDRPTLIGIFLSAILITLIGFICEMKIFHN